MFASAAKQTKTVANTAATANSIFRVFIKSPLANSQFERQIAANHTPFSALVSQGRRFEDAFGMSAAGSRSLLRLADILGEANVVDVAQHGSSRREQRRSQELRVKGISAGRRAVHSSAAFENANALLAIVEAHQRAFVIQRAAPGFQIAQEVVHTAVGPVILRCSGRPRDYMGTQTSSRRSKCSKAG